MKTLQAIKNWFCGGCVYFTAITLILLLLNLPSSTSAGIAVTRVLLIFPCGLLLSLGWTFWKSGLPRWGRALLLYIIDVLAVYLLLYLPFSATGEAAAQLLMFVLLSIVFWIIFGLVALVTLRVRRLMEED